MSWVLYMLWCHCPPMSCVQAIYQESWTVFPQRKWLFPRWQDETGPGCSFPHTFYFPDFILLTLCYCYKSGNSNTWKKRPVIVAWGAGEQPTSTPVNHTPEFVSGENDPALQEQRGEHPEEETQAQGGEKAFKVDMFQPGIWRPAELYYLQGGTTSNRSHTQALHRFIHRRLFPSGPHLRSRAG